MSAVPQLAVGILQWWLWGSVLALGVLTLARAAGERRAELQDALLRAALVAQALLFVSSLAIVRESPPPAREIMLGSVAGGLARLEPLPLQGRAAPPEIGSAAVKAPRAALGFPAIRPLRLEIEWPAHGLAAGLLVYLAGIAVGLGLLARQWLRFSKLRALGQRSEHPALRQALEAAARRGIGGRPEARRPPEVFVSPAYGNVFLVGWLRPAILFPAALLDSLSRAQVECLLAHEMAHAKRRDLSWFAFQRLVLLLSWPLPFQRWMLSAMGRAAEILCDREARRGTEAEGYARALIEVLRLRREPEASALAATGLTKSFARRRIEMILATDGAPARAGAWRTVLALLLAAALAVPALGVQVRARGGAVLAGAPRGDLARAEEKGSPPPVGKALDPAAMEEEARFREELRQAKDRLVGLYVQKGAESYKAGDLETAHHWFWMAGQSGIVEPKIYPLTDKHGLLVFHCAPGSLLHGAIERRFGKLEARESGTWVELEHNFLVLDRDLLDKIAEAFLPSKDEKRQVCLELQVLGVDPKDAARWARTLGGEPASREWAHELTAEESAALGQAIEAKASGLKKIQGAMITTFDGNPAQVLICAQSAYVAKYDLVSREGKIVPEPVLEVFDDGYLAEVLPFIVKDLQVRLLIRSTLTNKKEMKKARIDLPPHGEGLLIEIPILEKQVVDTEVVVSEGKKVLLGKSPTEAEAAAGAQLLWTCVEVTLYDSRRQPAR